MESPSLSRRRKRFIKEFHKQAGKCYWCDAPMLMRWDIPAHISYKIVPYRASREHLIPACDAHGHDGWSNIKITCHSCNDIRQTISHDAFKWVSSNPDRYAKFIEYKAHKENIIWEKVQKKKGIGKLKGIVMCATMFYMLNLYAYKFTYQPFPSN